MQAGILDRKFPHRAAGKILPVQGLRQPEVFPQHVSLGVNRWRLQRRPARQQRERLPENPRVADRPPRNAHSVDAGALQHRHTGLRGEQVARADHDAVAGVPFDGGQKIPAAWADIFLLHAAAVHGDRRRAAVEGAVEDRPKLVGARLRVVDAPPHLERDGNVGGNGLPHPRNNLERGLGHAEEIAAAAAAEHLLHRAAKVDVDHVEARRDEPPRRRREIVGIRPHQLPTDGMLVVGDRDPGEVSLVRADHGHERVEQHLAECVGGAVLPGQQPHRQIAVAGERGLHDRRRERHAPDRKGGHVSTGHRSNHVRPCAAIHSKLESGPQSPVS